MFFPGLFVASMLFNVLCTLPKNVWKMGREKDAKEDEKAKHKATKLKRLSDSERAGAGGDNIKKRWVLRVSAGKLYIYTHVYDRHSLANTLSLFHHERLRGHYQISSPSHRVLIAAPWWYMHLTEARPTSVQRRHRDQIKAVFRRELCLSCCRMWRQINLD